jgi:hypothetical protein
MSSSTEKLELSNSLFYIRKLDSGNSVWYDLTTARFLSLSDVFNKEIEQAREILNMQTTVDYRVYNRNRSELQNTKELEKLPKQELTTTEKGVTLDHLIAFKKIHASGKQGHLEELAFRIIKLFNLAPRWQFSIEILIISNTLILPIENTVYAHLNIPNDPEPNFIPPSEHLYRNKGIADDAIKMHTHLTITVSEKMTISELTKRLANIDEIEYLLDQLPKFNKSRVKDEVMYWGHLVWATLEFVDPNMSLPEIEKYFEKLNSEENVPEHRKLNLYYKRFLEARHKLGF